MANCHIQAFVRGLDVAHSLHGSLVGCSSRTALPQSGCRATFKTERSKTEESEMVRFYKEIPDTDGSYHVSPDGTVLSVRGKRTRKLRTSVGASGYKKLSLGAARPNIEIHRLVATVHIPKPDGCDVVNHKDGDKHNNHVDNLEWTTQRENMLHSYRVLGQNNCGIPVEQLTLCGKVVRRFESAASAEGFHAGHIGSCCQGNEQTHAGFKWRYANG